MTNAQGTTLPNFNKPLACIFHGDAFESGWMGV
jgi:hypothetical protein